MMLSLTSNYTHFLLPRVGGRWDEKRPIGLNRYLDLGRSFVSPLNPDNPHKVWWFSSMPHHRPNLDAIYPHFVAPSSCYGAKTNWVLTQSSPNSTQILGFPGHIWGQKPTGSECSDLPWRISFNGMIWPYWLADMGRWAEELFSGHI